jgi:predicted metalloprotease
VAAVGLRFVLGGPGSADGPVSTTQAQPTPTYENSDFQVPAPNPNPSPAPAPQTWEEVDQFMKQNALYDVTLREPVECPGTGIDPSTATLQEKGAYYNQLTECLVRVWAPSAAEVGFDVHRPYITMYDGPITTKCGTFKDTANGFYCDADGQIYIGSMDWSMVPAELQATRMNGDATMGHEFGHLVQDRTGIIGALRSFQYKNKGTPLELEYNRRLEQQADCFGGLFINSIAQSRRITDEERRLAGTLARSFGAAPGSTHGTPNSREYWTLEGVDTAEIKACNTFVVPSSQVE